MDSKDWNLCFPILEPFVPSSRNYRFSNVGTHASQPWNRAFPIQKTAGSQRLESILPKLGTIGFQFWELPGPRRWPQNFEILRSQIANSGKRRTSVGLQRLEPIFPGWNHGFQVPPNSGSQRLKLCLVT